MNQTDTRQVLLGALLLLVGSAIIVGVSGQFVSNVPLVLGSLAALGLAAGTLLIGTSDPGRPV